VIREAGWLKAALPRDVLAVLERHEASGDYHHPEYESAMMEFYRRHICRLDPWPDPLLRTFNNLISHPVVYETMQGPNEFTITGNLKGWERAHTLRDIRVPTLITCGRHDELGPTCAESLRRGIAGSEVVVFEDSAHMTMLEETERYLQTLAGFFARAERG
jgi:proline-specific peptidase